MPAPGACETAVPDPEATTPEATTTGATSPDPFAPLDVSPRGAHLLAGLALVAAVLTIVGGLAPLAGPIGMVLGLLGHVKGSRLGLPAAVLAGVGMVVGFSIAFLLR